MLVWNASKSISNSCNDFLLQHTYSAKEICYLGYKTYNSSLGESFGSWSWVVGSGCGSCSVDCKCVNLLNSFLSDLLSYSNLFLNISSIIYLVLYDLCSVILEIPSVCCCSMVVCQKKCRFSSRMSNCIQKSIHSGNTNKEREMLMVLHRI
jgi:hypothetical protein